MEQLPFWNLKRDHKSFIRLMKTGHTMKHSSLSFTEEWDFLKYFVGKKIYNPIFFNTLFLHNFHWKLLDILPRWLLTFKSGHFLIASGQSWECEREDYLEDLIKTKYRKNILNFDSAIKLLKVLATGDLHTQKTLLFIVKDGC